MNKKTKIGIGAIAIGTIAGVAYTLKKRHDKKLVKELTDHYVELHSEEFGYNDMENTTVIDRGKYIEFPKRTKK